METVPIPLGLALGGLIYLAIDNHRYGQFIQTLGESDDDE